MASAATPARDGRASRDQYLGPAVLAAGFRPFFLAAGLFGLGVVPLWMAVWSGWMTLAGPFAPVDWHAHEMIWGYGAAAVAGFLSTAIPNWTGRLPVRGWPLFALVALWLAGRLAVAGLLPLGAPGVMAVDTAFLAAVLAVTTREVVAGRNWRNLMVLAPVAMLLAGNVLVHAEVMRSGTADTGRRLGLAMLVLLVTLIGGRIGPSFTRNWLVQRGETRLPASAGRLDAVALALGAVALLAWTFAPERAAAALLLVAAMAHAVRLARWRGLLTWRSPLLLMLHLAYAFVPLGLVAAAFGALGVVAVGMGDHLLGIGAIGGMTVAVMMRATMGHTGRPLVAGPLLTAAFALVLVAAALRALAPGITVAGIGGIGLAATLWTAGFGLLVLRLSPWLVGPKAGRRASSQGPSQDSSQGPSQGLTRPPL